MNFYDFLKVHECFDDVNNKEEDAMYPTGRIIHHKFQDYLSTQGIQGWSFMTSYRVLIALGFR